MEFVEQSVELIPQPKNIEDIYRNIERAARVCYKSEDKITKDSSKRMVENLETHKHDAMLEHGSVYLQIPSNEWGNVGLEDNPRCRYNEYDGNVYVTTNFREMKDNFVVGDFFTCWEKYQDYVVKPDENFVPRYMLHITTSIGVARELTRHRVFSFAQESTRYVSSCAKRNISEFNCDCVEDIIEAYNQGFSMREIAEYSSMTEWEVRKKLIENDIPIRGLHNTGHRIEDYFTNIDTAEKAYLIGLIQTDGNVAITDRNASLTITQHKDYAWYIECLLHNFSDKVCKTNDRNCNQLSIGSKNIVKDLIDIGIVPAKTKLQTDEDIIKLWNAIPEQFKGDFIRGLIDGDGWVSYFTQKKGINESCNIGLCSVKESLIDLVIQFIKSKFDYECGKYYDGCVHKLAITNYKKSIEIGKYLYKNFQYPFGHPKKASSWIKRMGLEFPLATFGDPNFKIIKPHWVDDTNPENIFAFMRSISNDENVYTNLRLSGCSAQEAREILPLCTKTELMMTGFIDDWLRFLEIRMLQTTGRVHPDMLKLAILINNKLRLIDRRRVKK